jgi:hypothetical protein
MKSIKEKAKEAERNIHPLFESISEPTGEPVSVYDQNDMIDMFEAGANYVLDAITECLPKTHSFNPNEVIDIIASRIKQLKK